LLMRFTGISGILYRNKWYTLPELMVHFNGIVVQYGMEYPVRNYAKLTFLLTSFNCVSCLVFIFSCILYFAYLQYFV
ncbi:hypothetical protein, partial [Myroides odoratimimus]|uniref:hypothetical protein n=1 Tax=Myroides odoratimimus TaxID=76832 RepID=UPI002574E2BA